MNLSWAIAIVFFVVHFYLAVQLRLRLTVRIGSFEWLPLVYLLLYNMPKPLTIIQLVLDLFFWIINACFFQVRPSVRPCVHHACKQDTVNEPTKNPSYLFLATSWSKIWRASKRLEHSTSSTIFERPSCSAELDRSSNNKISIYLFVFKLVSYLHDLSNLLGPMTEPSERRASERAVGLVCNQQVSKVASKSRHYCYPRPAVKSAVWKIFNLLH